jgi:hypothetical protein
VPVRRRAGREGAGWEIIATEFLDYGGARSLEDPDLSTEDVAVALGSAAEAALAAVVLDAYRHKATSVFIPYTGSRVIYEGSDTDDTADSLLHLDDWLRALVAGDREAFERELAVLLSVHRDHAGGRPPRARSAVRGPEPVSEESLHRPVWARPIRRHTVGG